VPTSDRCSVALETGDPSRMGKQKTASAGAPRDDAVRWTGIDWPTVRRNVRRLQCRIAKAVKEGRWNKVQALQHLLTRSLHAKLMAVQRVAAPSIAAFPALAAPCHNRGLPPGGLQWNA